MYLTPEELKTKIYEYQLSQITEDDESIVLEAIQAAVDETSSYLSGRFDTAAIFSAEGTQRNAFVLSIVKTLAVWQIIQLSNVDILYDRIREEYDRAINWLNRVATGKVNPDLPAASSEQSTGFDIISDQKQNNDY